MATEIHLDPRSTAALKAAAALRGARIFNLGLLVLVVLLILQVQYFDIPSDQARRRAAESQEELRRVKEDAAQYPKFLAAVDLKPLRRFTMGELSEQRHQAYTVMTALQKEKATPAAIKAQGKKIGDLSTELSFRSMRFLAPAEIATLDDEVGRRVALAKKRKSYQVVMLWVCAAAAVALVGSLLGLMWRQRIGPFTMLGLILYWPWVVFKWLRRRLWGLVTLQDLLGGNYEASEAHFLIRQLGPLSRPGVDMPAGLRALARGFRSRPLKKAVEAIAAKLAAGAKLFDAFSGYPAFFDPTTMAVLKAAEKNGNLEQLVADRSVRLKGSTMRDLQGLLFYSVWVGGYTVLILTFLMVKVIPTFEDVFDSFGAQLPWLTLVVIAFSHWMEHLFFWVASGGALLFFSLRYAVRHRSKGLELALQALPGVRSVLEANRLGQALGILRSALKARTPLPEALDEAAEAAGPCFGPGFRQAAERIRSGEDAATALSQAEALPALLRWYFAAGAGQDLSQVVAELADLYEDRYRSYREQLPMVLETSFCVVLGLVVAFFLVGMFLPFFSLGTIVQL